MAAIRVEPGPAHHQPDHRHQQNGGNDDATRRQAGQASPPGDRWRRTPHVFWLGLEGWRSLRRGLGHDVGLVLGFPFGFGGCADGFQGDVLSAHAITNVLGVDIANIIRRDMVAHAFLIVDGDDTLWENNVYFEEAIEAFTDFLAHSSLSREQVRATLDQIELLNIRVHGYGSAAFARNLRQCYERLAERNIRKEDLDHVMALGKRIVEQPMRVLAGVAETVAYLAGRHELTLFTKGELEEQRLKVERSGLGPQFDRVAVVAEKDARAYRQLVDEHGFDPARTWMIGNSPKSDINPALQAGINAVFIPHTHTWRLEAEEIPGADGRLLVLERFSQLRDHF